MSNTRFVVNTDTADPNFDFIDRDGDQIRVVYRDDVAGALTIKVNGEVVLVPAEDVELFLSHIRRVTEKKKCTTCNGEGRVAR